MLFVCFYKGLFLELGCNNFCKNSNFPLTLQEKALIFYYFLRFFCGFGIKSVPLPRFFEHLCDGELSKRFIHLI